MSGMQLEFLVSGDEEVALELRGLSLRVADVAPAFEVLSKVYEKNHERWFNTRGSGTWPPLRPGTKRIKRKAGTDPRPLFGKTRRLYNSLAGESADSARYFTTHSFVFGTTVEYARFHRYGTVHMQERNPLVRTVFLESETRALLTGYLMGPIGKIQRRGFATRSAGWWR